MKTTQPIPLHKFYKHEATTSTELETGPVNNPTKRDKMPDDKIDKITYLEKIMEKLEASDPEVDLLLDDIAAFLDSEEETSPAKQQPVPPSENMDTSESSATLSMKQQRDAKPTTVQPKKKPLKQPSFQKRGRTKRRSFP